MAVNLLTNAAKYTPTGGHIQLIAGVEGGEFVCRVRDNGVGIPPELLPRMFDLFAQADRSLARSENVRLSGGDGRPGERKWPPCILANRT
jgi:signal transduction histidine kinase